MKKNQVHFKALFKIKKRILLKKNLIKKSSAKREPRFNQELRKKILSFRRKKKKIRSKLKERMMAKEINIKKTAEMMDKEIEMKIWTDLPSTEKFF